MSICIHKTSDQWGLLYPPLQHINTNIIKLLSDFDTRHPQLPAGGCEQTRSYRYTMYSVFAKSNTFVEIKLN